MRLDFFLKTSRLCPRRSVAQKLCDAGLVLLNGNVVKSAHPVKINDEITLKRNRKLTTVRVLTVPETKQVSRSSVAAFYQIIVERDDEEEDTF